MRRIFIEKEKCDGCKNCSIACMAAHREVPGTVYDLDMRDPQNEARHSIKSDGRGGYVPLFCRHCAVPECATACMSGALFKDPRTGHVQYDGDRCGACFMCVMSCPYGNIKPDRVSHKRIIKCDFCIDDQEEPNCVKNCPKKALHVEEVLTVEAAV
ncbi:MAG: 4Fe-4S dicluster domain-containing protein [Treponema sp.]|jgi:carbon-monoxide dehydrogenase iron sulfur subunit|nr:4Fe-4S dicluster domain-containing protein [Treponema sp.]